MIFKVLIADDHAIVRDGLRLIVEAADGFAVAGDASDGETTLDLVKRIPADLLLLDLSMPQAGIPLLQRIRTIAPDLRIVVLTMHSEHQYLVRAFNAGAAGYITKESAGSELVAALNKVASGGAYVSLSMAEQMATKLNVVADVLPHRRLSNREVDVLRGIVSGKSVTEISEELSISIKTVSTYKTRLLEKMEVSHQAGLIRYALEHGLIDT